MSLAPHTILVHGFIRSRYDMALLAMRLRKLLPQTSVHLFGYPSRRNTIEESAKQLADFIDNISKGAPISFVGHSLGGLVVRALDASNGSRTPLHRLVTLGTPHQGSVVAEVLSRSSFTRAVAGPVLLQLARPPLPAKTSQLEVGCVIGCLNSRFGFMPILPGDNDGLVCVREAVFPHSSEEVRTPILHSLFPYSSRAALLTARFLQNGSFNPQ